MYAGNLRILLDIYGALQICLENWRTQIQMVEENVSHFRQDLAFTLYNVYPRLSTSLDFTMTSGSVPPFSVHRTSRVDIAFTANVV